MPLRFKNSLSFKITIFLSINVVYLILHFKFSLPLIKEMYFERAHPLLNHLLRWREHFPLEFYYFHMHLRGIIFAIGMNIILLHISGFNLISYLSEKVRTKSIPFCFLWGLLISSPILIAGYFSFIYHFRIPWMDTWFSVEYIDKYLSGTLTLSDLWEWHGGGYHRNFLPRLIQVLTAKWFDWQFIYVIAMTHLLALLVLILISVRCAGLERGRLSEMTFVLIPLFSSLIFSLRMEKTWTWDQGVVFYCCIFPVVAALFILTKKESLHWSDFIYAALLGVAASFSYSAGLMFWPAIWPILILKEMPIIRKQRILILWIFFSLITILFYMWGFHPASVAKEPILLWQKAIDFIFYFLIYLGGTLAFPDRALWVGIIGIILFFYCVRIVLKNKEMINHGTIFFLSLGSYSIFAGLMISAGRSFIGPYHALAFNYANFSCFFWISLCMLLVVIVKSESLIPFKFNFRKQQPCLIFFFIFLNVSVALLSCSYIARIKAESQFVNQYEEALSQFEDVSIFKPITQNVELLSSRREILRKYHLNLFRKK